MILAGVFSDQNMLAEFQWLIIGRIIFATLQFNSDLYISPQIPRLSKPPLYPSKIDSLFQKTGPILSLDYSHDYYLYSWIKYILG